MRTAFLAAALLMTYCRALPAAETVWLEAETFGPLKGANFSYMPVERTTRGSWSVAGPDTAASWTQGGESEWMSIAARADEPNPLTVGRQAEAPVDGEYALWVRYADYRGKKEQFGIRVIQRDFIAERSFGQHSLVDEMDPMKLLWDWSFAWDRATIPLKKGPFRVEISTLGPSEARRCVDVLCLTTDAGYRPSGREKPDHPTWALLRSLRERPTTPPALLPALRHNDPTDQRRAPSFIWNTGLPWGEELKKPAGERVDPPFGVDPPLLKDFIAAFKGKSPPIFGSRLSGPVWHIPFYPKAFADGSPYRDWLDRNPAVRFAILLNYGAPKWQAGKDRPSDRAALRKALKQYGDRFLGFVAGENIAYANVDSAAVEAAVKQAKTRGEVLAALKETNTRATRAKFEDYFGAPVTAEEAWAPVISCLSANMEAWSHGLGSLGVKRIGHENTGNSPTLARRLAFLRGASRQFDMEMVNYQSCNLGDSATMFSREHYFYPASSRYILDNSYDAWAGAGTSWLWKDYLLWHLAGVDAFYNEQGIDLFWKPGGNSAGDDFPVQLSPKGKVAEAAIRLAETHPRGSQYTPIAFLLDEAHGWSQERFEPGAFALDPALNPTLLTPGRHEASIRGWFDVAYFPAPETQNEPATAIRQTYVNGVFGDIFDVIVTAAGRTKALTSYPVIVCAGEIWLSEEWGRALSEYVRAGGRLVVSDAQLTGPGSSRLRLPRMGAVAEADSFAWSITGERISSNRFRFRPLQQGTPIALTAEGSAVAAIVTEGKGQVTMIGVPLGLGIDARPVPLLGMVLKELADAVTPFRVRGDVEWTMNRLQDGRWLIGLLNNRGILKPQHGVNPTDAREAHWVEIRTPFVVQESEEWLAEQKVEWKPSGAGSSASLVVPAGAARLISIKP